MGDSLSHLDDLLMLTEHWICFCFFSFMQDLEI